MLNGSQMATILIKSVYCLNVIEQIPHDPCSTIYGLPMLGIFFVHVCGCVEGWMVENAEFYDIFVHYQYADCATAQYEPNMHTKRHMLHRTLNTAEPSDAYVSLYGQSQEALNARSTSIYSQFKPDMLHALGCFIFKRHFWQNMMIYGTSENCALLSMF